MMFSFQSYAKNQRLHAIANEIYKRNLHCVNRIPGIHDNGPPWTTLWRLTLTAYNSANVWEPALSDGWIPGNAMCRQCTQFHWHAVHTAPVQGNFTIPSRGPLDWSGMVTISKNTGWPRKNATLTINNFKKTRDRIKKLCALLRIKFFSQQDYNQILLILMKAFCWGNVIFKIFPSKILAPLLAMPMGLFFVVGRLGGPSEHARVKLCSATQKKKLPHCQWCQGGAVFYGNSLNWTCFVHYNIGLNPYWAV